MTVDAPSPVLPRYGRDCVASLVPALLGPAGTSDLPEWFPECARGARRVVLFVLDGLGWNQLRDRAAIAPTLSAMEARVITTVAPTTTATALTSITTGLTPAEHGLLGYRVDMGDTVMNILRWADAAGDRRTSHPPGLIQSCPPFMGMRVPVASKAELEDTGFTKAHLDGVRPVGWRVSSSIPVIVADALGAGDDFVYAYYDGVDKVAHERGLDAHYDAELAHADRLVAEVLSRLDHDTVLLVTADHGQVHVGDAVVRLGTDVLDLVKHQSGEGRFRWLHARRGAAPELLAACAVHGDVAWVVGREQVLDERWFGPHMSEAVARRLGDVALVAHGPVTFDDPAESSLAELVCRHGSMTADEVLVPLLAARGGGVGMDFAPGSAE